MVLEQEQEDAVRMTPKTSWIWDERSPGSRVGRFQCRLVSTPLGMLLPSPVFPVIGFDVIALDVAQACPGHYGAEGSSLTCISSTSRTSSKPPAWSNNHSVLEISRAALLS